LSFLCAVTRTRAACGVEAPGGMRKSHGKLEPSTFDWRADPGSPSNLASIVAAFEVMDLATAFAAHHRHDSHCVTYVVSKDGVPLKHQPRVNKGGLEWVLSLEGFSILVDHLHVDVDNPGKERWTPETIAALTWPDGCGIYLTRGGYHLVQPLDEPVPVSSVELYLAAWHEELRDVHAIHVDTQCKDWTRLFRLPNVVREGRVFTSPLVDISRMHPRVIVPKAPARRPSGRRENLEVLPP
jgi:hypothetical protein